MREDHRSSGVQRVLAGVKDLFLVTLTWWLVSLSGVLMPGPISAMAVSEGARRGVIAGPLITAGHAVAELAMLGALAVGLSRILQQPMVVGAIGIFGGLVLLWMGWGIVKASRGEPVDPALAPETGARTRGNLVRTGLFATIGNPYWVLWWVTVGAAYFVAFSRFGVVALIVLFLLGHLALDLGWNSFLALVVGAGRGRVPARAYRIILGSCGVFVILMSVYFVYSGIGFLTRR